MKKMLSIILAIVMVCSLSVTAFAADNEQSWTGSETINSIGVSATVDTASTTTPAAKYSVHIAWTTPTITYTANASTYEWSPSDLQYKETAGTGGSWSENNTTTVTVTNSSNANVYASVKYTDVDTDNATSAATWKIGETDYTAGTQQEIGSAAVSNGVEIDYKTDTKGTAQSCVFTGSITVSGTLATGGQIGTITVTLAAGSN